MRTMTLRNNETNEYRRLTTKGNDVFVEGKEYKAVFNSFEETRRNTTLEDVARIYTTRGFEIIYTA